MKQFAPVENFHDGSVDFTGRMKTDAVPVRNRQGDIGIRHAGRADVTDGIPELTPAFCFTWMQIGKIRLVVGVNSGHQFDVGAELAILIRVGQVAIPRIAEFMVAPGPLFLAG